MNRWTAEAQKQMAQQADLQRQKDVAQQSRFFGTDRTVLPVAFTRSLVRRSWFARVRAAFAVALRAFRREFAQEFEQ